MSIQGSQGLNGLARVGRSETLLGGAFSEGGSVFAWEQETLRLPPTTRIDAALRQLPADGHGLTVLPFVAGERSPGFAPGARACIAGLTSATTPLQILQASLEAVSYRFALVARLLRPHLDARYDIVASGGALARSPYWVQLMADVLEHPVLVSRETELTSRGTAILAWRGLGEWDSLDRIALKLPRACVPEPKRSEIYREAIERQRELYDRVIGA